MAITSVSKNSSFCMCVRVRLRECVVVCVSVFIEIQWTKMDLNRILCTHLKTATSCPYCTQVEAVVYRFIFCLFVYLFQVDFQKTHTPPRSHTERKRHTHWLKNYIFQKSHNIYIWHFGLDDRSSEQLTDTCVLIGRIRISHHWCWW